MTVGRHPVDDDPVMASAIGRCSNAWTHCEAILTRIFASLTGLELKTAVIIFSAFRATRTQSEVLQKLIRLGDFPKNLSDQLAADLKLYQQLAERRNELLHNPIGRSVENQIYIMLRAPQREGDIPYFAKPIEPAEIDNLADQIRGLTTSLLEIDLEGLLSRARNSVS
jgi:hypothetical protein